MESVWPVSKLSIESVGSRHLLVANSCTHRRRRRDATKQFRRVGGVYWALRSLYFSKSKRPTVTMFSIRGQDQSSSSKPPCWKSSACNTGSSRPRFKISSPNMAIRQKQFWNEIWLSTKFKMEVWSSFPLFDCMLFLFFLYIFFFVFFLILLYFYYLHFS